MVLEIKRGSKKAFSRAIITVLVNITIKEGCRMAVDFSHCLSDRAVRKGTGFHLPLGFPQFQKTESGTIGRGQMQRHQKFSELKFMTSSSSISKKNIKI